MFLADDLPPSLHSVCMYDLILISPFITTYLCLMSISCINISLNNDDDNVVAGCSFIISPFVYIRVRLLHRQSSDRSTVGGLNIVFKSSDMSSTELVARLVVC